MILQMRESRFDLGDDGNKQDEIPYKSHTKPKELPKNEKLTKKQSGLDEKITWTRATFKNLIGKFIGALRFGNFKKNNIGNNSNDRDLNADPVTNSGNNMNNVGHGYENNEAIKNHVDSHSSFFSVVSPFIDNIQTYISDPASTKNSIRREGRANHGANNNDTVSNKISKTCSKILENITPDGTKCNSLQGSIKNSSKELNFGQLIAFSDDDTTLTKDQKKKKQLEQFFKILDKDGDGVLSIEELKMIMPNRSETDMFMANADEDLSNNIDFEEFYGMMLEEIRKIQSIMEEIQVFEKGDPEQAAFVGNEEIIILLNSSKDFLSVIDQDGNGEIDFAEFREFYLGWRGNVWQ